MKSMNIWQCHLDAHVLTLTRRAKGTPMEHSGYSAALTGEWRSSTHGRVQQAEAEVEEDFIEASVCHGEGGAHREP